MQPFTPFVSEELWHLIRERAEGDDIILAQWPKVEAVNSEVLQSFEKASDVITHIRNVRKQNNIASKVKMELMIKKNSEIDISFDSVIVKMGNLSQLEYVSEKVANANSFLVQGNDYYIPFGETIDVEAEKKKISEDIAYTKGFLKSVQSKLQNEKFMAGAPEAVVANERKKEEDALQTIRILEEKLEGLG
jgi:valyl-tRNA synthetase